MAENKSNSNNSHKVYHHLLVKNMTERISAELGKNPPTESSDELVQRLALLCEDINSLDDEGLPLGQLVLCSIVANFQQFMPVVPRDLFWFYGGDCMHYLGDEEIDSFQLIDQRYYSQCSEEGEQNTDYEAIRADVLGLH